MSKDREYPVVLGIYEDVSAVSLLYLNSVNDEE